MNKTMIVAAMIAAPLLIASPSFAADENNVAPGLTAAGAPLGLHGVDPVAFIEIGNRVEGQASFTYVHDGVAYYFASEDNMDRFADDPDRYVPQNGGFCTYGVSVGKKFDGDPQYASVVDGQLYVFLNEEVFRAYQQDQHGTIERADEKWGAIRSTAASDL